MCLLTPVSPSRQTEVTGNSLQLVQFTLRVRSAAPAGVVARALWLQLDEMVNSGNLVFVQGARGLVVDSGDQVRSQAAQLEVHWPTEVAIFAWTDAAQVQF
jgi:hypothetical protein